MFNFRNIDSFIPGKFESIGMLKGKRWYLNQETGKIGLFKPKRFEFGDRKVFCANHYGEFVAHKIAENANINSCPVELAHLSKYYANIHKERNNGTPEEKDGCITYNLLDEESNLEPGQIVINSFELKNKKEFDRLTKQDIKRTEKYDNLEVILEAISARTKEYYLCQKNNFSVAYINEKIKENKKRMIEMMVYDCLFGNNDRHDENWSMEKKIDGSDISIYPLYDNERILGLYENQYKIEHSLKTNSVENFSEENLFSRMKVPGETKSHSTYKDVLTYLVEHYELETREVLNRLFEKNTPQKINSILDECERLPECYKEFGSQMYQTRYNFAKNLCIKKDIQSKKQMGIQRIYFEYPNISKQTSNRVPEYPEL